MTHANERTLVILVMSEDGETTTVSDWQLQ